MEWSRNLLIVGLGGCLGSMARYGVGVIFTKYFSQNFPYGTFTVNLVGCLLMGFFYGIFEKNFDHNSAWRLFLMVGICGGFTTFSSFSLENLNLLQSSNYTGFFLYSVGSFVLGLLAIWIGLTLTKLI
jgi:CrcB protein